MIGDDKGTTYKYEDGELVSRFRNPPEGLYPFNYVAAYLRAKFRKYFDKNPRVRALLNTTLICKDCGFEKCICKSIKLSKLGKYNVAVYEVDNLYMAQCGNKLPKFLKDRIIVKTCTIVRQRCNTLPCCWYS